MYGVGMRSCAVNTVIVLKHSSLWWWECPLSIVCVFVNQSELQNILFHLFFHQWKSAKNDITRQSRKEHTAHSQGAGAIRYYRASKLLIRSKSLGPTDLW